MLPTIESVREKQVPESGIQVYIAIGFFNIYPVGSVSLENRLLQHQRCLKLSRWLKCSATVENLRSRSASSLRGSMDGFEESVSF